MLLLFDLSEVECVKEIHFDAGPAPNGPDDVRYHQVAFLATHYLCGGMLIQDGCCRPCQLLGPGRIGFLGDRDGGGRRGSIVPNLPRLAPRVRKIWLQRGEAAEQGDLGRCLIKTQRQGLLKPQRLREKQVGVVLP